MKTYVYATKEKEKLNEHGHCTKIKTISVKKKRSTVSILNRKFILMIHTHFTNSLSYIIISKALLVSRKSIPYFEIFNFWSISSIPTDSKICHFEGCTMRQV